MYNASTRSFASTIFRPMADRELVEARHKRRQEAAEVLESMFPGLGGADPKSPSNVVSNFMVREKLTETRFDDYAGKYELRRSDRTVGTLPEYVLARRNDRNFGFSAADIRRVSVPEKEVVLDSDYDGLPTIEKSSD